jgi:hypothetical protein
VTASALSPAGALAWLASLSIDLEATAILDARGEVVAGDPALGRRAAEALAAVPGAQEVDHGDLLAVRAGGHAAAARVGRHALRGVVRGDLAAAAAAVEGPGRVSSAGP